MCVSMCCARMCPCTASCRASCIIVRGWPSGDEASSHPFLGPSLSPSLPPNDTQALREKVGHEGLSNSGVVKLLLKVYAEMLSHSTTPTKPLTKDGDQCQIMHKTLLCNRYSGQRHSEKNLQKTMVHNLEYNSK